MSLQTEASSGAASGANGSSASYLERAWLGYHAVIHVGMGLANLLAPFDILQTRIERSGGGSVQALFGSLVKEVEAAQKEPASATSTSNTSNTSNSPYAAALGGLSTPQPGQPQPAALAAAARLDSAKENLDSLAALVATALFQVQYSVAGDALVATLAISALRTDSPAERRLVHRCLGLVKSAQYFVYIWSEVLTSGYLSAFNVIGLGISVAAAITWGLPRVEKKKITAAGPASKNGSEKKADVDASKGLSPY